MITLPNQSGAAALFTHSGGVPRWYSVRLQATAPTNAGSAEIQVNGVSVETEIGAPTVNVGPGTPEMLSTHLLLNDGDAVSVVVQGGPLDLVFGGSQDEEHF